MSRIWSPLHRYIQILVVCVVMIATFGVASAQPALSSPAVLPGDRASSPAVGRQEMAEIAKGGNGYLAVWADNRTSLRNVSFSGPYFGTGLGSMVDIYAARLDANGNLVDTTPIIISQAQYNQFAPQVAWNGQNWLVVWATERESNRYYYDILAVRVAPDGRMLDSSPILIKSSATSNQPTPWSVSSDGTNWSVVWRDLDDAAGIFTIDGARIAPDGTLLDPGGKRLRRDSWNSGATSADLAFAGDEYLLTWMELAPSTGNWIVRGQRLTPALDLIGGIFTINLYSPSDPDAPKVASDGTNFLVVWSEERYYGYSQLFGTRVSHTGQVLDPSGIQITGASGYTLFKPDVAWNGTNYVVAYNNQPNFGDEDLFVTRLSSAGQVLDTNGILVKSGPGNQNRPTIAPGVAGGAQVAWIDTQLSSDGDIYAAPVTANGAAGTSSAVSLGAPRQSRPRMAASGSGYLVVMQSETSNNSRILAQRLDAVGNAIDQEPLLMASGSTSLTNPSVAWNGSLYLVVWENNDHIYGRRVLPDGTLLDGAPIAIMPGNTPDAAALGDSFLVVDTKRDPALEHIRYAQAVRVSGQGNVLGAPLKLGVNFDVWPRVVALGSQWLVVWEQNVSHDDARSTVVGAFVGADGSSAGKFSISNGGYDDTPHLAVAGDTALIAWAESDIFGRRIQADGTLLDSAAGITISNAPNGQFTPAVAWNGTQYLVTYLDHRNDGYPNQERGDIYGTGVDANGVVLDPSGFAVANSPLPEQTPSIVASNGFAIFAYAAFADRAPYDALRITLRTTGSGTIEPAPAAPNNLAATAASSARVDLAWTDNSNNETGFKIERKSGVDGTYAQIAVVGANATNYGDTSVGGSTTYSYRVRAYNTTGDSAYSAEASATTPNSPPVVSITSPTNGAAFLAPANITVAASASDSDGTVSQVNFYAGTTLIGTDTASPYSIVWSNVAAGSYTLTARATDNAGATTTSAGVNITVNMSSPPAAPTNLTASSTTKGQVKLTWTDNSNNETGFKIERSISASTGFVEIATVDANMTSYINQGLTSRTTYYYRVRAANASGYSAYSNTASVRVK